MGAPRDLRETLGPCRAPAPRRESAPPGRFGRSGPCRLAARPRLLAARGALSSPASPAWEKASAGDSSRTLQPRLLLRPPPLSTSSRLFLPPHVCRVRTPRVTRSASADSQRRCGRLHAVASQARRPEAGGQPRTSALPAREGGRSCSLFYFHKMHIPEVRGETRVSPLTQNAVRRPKEEGVDIRPSNHAEESSKEEESKNLGGGPDEKAVLCVFRQMLVLVIPV